MSEASGTLICFAVKEEARYFSPGTSDVLITGMGARNASSAVNQFLQQASPRRVITAGFAGGLNPALTLGTVLYQCDPELVAGLSDTGARAGTFHCAERVAVTAASKSELWRKTRADAVEMESAVIRQLCLERSLPSATVRVISDTATEDLPLDFNALMTPDDTMDYGKLARTVTLAPWKIPALMRFQKQTQVAARALASVLARLKF